MTKERAQPTTRRNHPAHGARLVALTSSLLVTGGLAAALAHSDQPPELEPTAPVPSSVTPTPAPDPSVTDPPIPTAPSRPGRRRTPDSQPHQLEPSATPKTTQGPALQLTGGYTDGVWLGPPSPTRWGDVQIEATIEGGRLVSIVPVQIPAGRISSSINDQAAPLLEAQAVAVQGAAIDTVSGATYTSWAYAESLQAALDEAALASEGATGTDSAAPATSLSTGASS